MFWFWKREAARQSGMMALGALYPIHDGFQLP